MEEQEQLIHFLTTNTWPFHGNSNPERALLEKTIEEGGYESDEVKTFWVQNEEEEIVGIVKIYDLQDDIPLFDLRVADEYRGFGYGPKALKLITEFVFGLPEGKIRLEGHTRQDNLAMRKTFERAGFVKEGHMRNAWFSPKENSYYDAVTYGMTREDFLAGTTTPVMWEDAGYGEEPKKKKRIPNFPSQFESDRLIIRMPEMSDALDVFEALRNSLPALKPWLPFAQEEPELYKTEENLRESIADFITRKDLRLHIFLKETGEFIGSTGLHRINWAIPKFEIGYWLDTKFEGNGYMMEAVDRLTRFAFEDLGANRVEIRCDEENGKSRAIPVKLDYELEGILKSDSLTGDGKHLRNTCVYAKIK